MFAYSGIRWEDCEGTTFYYPLGEASVATSSLTSVVFCALLEFLTWWIRPRRWDTSPVEGLGVSDMVSIPCADEVPYVVPLGATW